MSDREPNPNALPVDDVDPALEHLYDRIAQILAIGFWASIAVIVAGLLVALVGGDAIGKTTHHMEDVVQEALRFSPSGLVDFGLLGLLLTPLAYVVMALVTFLRQRDWLFVGVCSALILLFVVTIALALS